MIEQTKKKIGRIQSLAAPSVKDLEAWQQMTDSQKRAVIEEKADQAAQSERRFMSADDIIREANAELKHG